MAEVPQVATIPSSMSVRRLVALALVIGGALLMFLAVFADQLNISGGGDGFGWKQLIAAIVGLVMVLLGLAWLLQPFAGALEEQDEFQDVGDSTEQP